MTMNDLVADMLTRVRNAVRNQQKTTEVIQSKLDDMACAKFRDDDASNIFYDLVE